MKSKSYFKFQPFSLKQRKVLNWWCDSSPVRGKDGIIADGAIRSGKTVSMSLSFVLCSGFFQLLLCEILFQGCKRGIKTSPCMGKTAGYDNGIF